jgi:UDP-glucose 4-epimerase
MLAACGRDGRRPAVVLLSSGGTVYSPAGRPPFRETSEVGPAGVYGRAKLAQEHAVLRAAEQVRPVILRLANVYGPGQSTHGAQGVVAHWLAAVAAGRPLRLIGEPSSRRDYVHVDDVAAAMVRVLRSQADPLRRAELDGAVLNIGSGQPTSLTELSAVVRAAVDRPIEIVRAPGRGFDRTDVWLDVRRAASVLGWTPGIGLADGVARTWRALVGSEREPMVSR